MNPKKASPLRDEKDETQKAVIQFGEVLRTLGIVINKYDTAKARPVLSSAGTLSIEKFCAVLRSKLGGDGLNFPDVFRAIHDFATAKDLIEAYAAENDLLDDGTKRIQIPPDLQNLTLNMNMAAKGRDERFFLTHPDETVSPVSGEMYLLVTNMQPPEAAAVARKVIPQYSPRGPKGIFEVKIGGKERTVFNMYTPPTWHDYVDWEKLPDELPILFQKLVHHVFPRAIERKYFYSWLHDSLYSRAYVFLILCGVPGAGKNRLKLVLRALHGHANAVDGKKLTLTERFNSQLSESTLCWYDELSYDAEMENTMKELQNDSISIERKGVDATRATKIHASVVISNNMPRYNYIPFDARKFVPLVVNNRRLDESMSPEEIDILSKKVEDESSDTFDIRFLAQTAKWLKNHGRSKKWPNLEYKGPMFWTLAHTSMTQWQKKAVTHLLESETKSEMARTAWDQQKKAYRWSSLQSTALRRHDRYLKLPDFTTARAFFETFRDGEGRQTFSTEPVPGMNVLGDFWVKPIFEGAKVVTEELVLKKMREENEKEILAL